MTKQAKEEIKLVSVNADVGTIGLDDLEDLNVETQKIEKESERQPSGVAVAYPESGATYKVRVFPDRDKKGKLRFFKRVFFHTINGFPSGKSRTKDNEERYRIIQNESLDKEIKSAESQGLKDSWKYRANEHVYLFVRLLECPKSDYAKPGQDVLLILTGQQGVELVKFWNELTPDQKISMLSPDKPHYAIELKFEDKASKFKKLESVKFAGSQEYTLGAMKLPENFVIDKDKGGLLDQVYVNEFDNTMTADQLNNIRNFLKYQLSLTSGIIDPIESSTKSYSKRETSQVTNDSAPNNFDSEEKCYIVQNQLTKEKGYENARFGNPPEGVIAECMICPNQNECEAIKNNK